ncbi:hypothetical protein LEP1GSC047_3354 [Leptospira inadai serovar Lyme str. 10]|uniref:Uncharacterized protein n=2 Tax=Leptospira inadai serovar Lyme TaxID=293084 RepID=V6HAH9_9LEPT|nr:hypothetical protein LEP1GSC047_3354 [Leptospira inadai serovar Lyme str. 10]PNV74871.1 hypothetical protein BES34_011395 [Leptospira inadai serovar Lyme]
MLVLRGVRIEVQSFDFPDSCNQKSESFNHWNSYKKVIYSKVNRQGRRSKLIFVLYSIFAKKVKLVET